MSHRTACLIGVALAIFAGVAAQSRVALAEIKFEVVKGFGLLEEALPSALVVGSDGALYGTADAGGPSDLGMVFRIDGAGNFTPLHSFSGQDDGRCPCTLVSGVDGALYGTTLPGPSDGGTVFRIDGAGDFTSLHSFSRRGPSALVVGGDGALYGTTYGGSSLDLGTVYRIDGSGAFTSLHSFHAMGGTYPDFVGSDGAYPGTLVVGSDGALYGTTSRGGSAGLGTVFRIDTARAFTSIHSFSGSDGQHPFYVLVSGSDGALYGTTQSGGASGLGTIFRIDTAANFESLHSFSGAGNGELPVYPLVRGSDDALYGSTCCGTVADVIFRIDNTGNFSVIHSGASPTDALVVGSDGALYGISANSVFRIDNGGTFTSLHTFPAGTDGYRAYPSLVLGSDGALYGTTPRGGSSGGGQVFRIDTEGTFASLFSFVAAPDGAHPVAALVRGSDGALYGSTRTGGAFGMGTVFRIDSAAGFESLHSFSGVDGAEPTAALVPSSSGALYGTTQSTIFRIDNAGGVSTLYLFLDDLSGSATLIRGTDGLVYGSTDHRIFKVEITGNVRTLFSFAFEEEGFCYDLFPNSAWTNLVMGSDGALYGFHTRGVDFSYGGCSANSTFFRIGVGSMDFTSVPGGPYNPLVLGSDGALYGTASNEVFRLGDAASSESVYSDDDFQPTGLLLGSDGALYGTTTGGGPYGVGTIFRIDGAGAFAFLHSFDHGADGQYPSPLFPGGDGALYGTTRYDDIPGEWNALFRIDGAGTFASLHLSPLSFHDLTPTLVCGEDGALYGTAEGDAASSGSVYRLFDETGPICVPEPALLPLAVTSGAVVLAIARRRARRPLLA